MWNSDKNYTYCVYDKGKVLVENTVLDSLINTFSDMGKQVLVVNYIVKNSDGDYSGCDINECAFIVNEHNMYLFSPFMGGVEVKITEYIKKGIQEIIDGKDNKKKQ